MAFAALPLSAEDGTHDSASHAPVNAAYVYVKDSNTAKDFSSFLSGHGVNITSLKSSNARDVDFSTFELIIIDPLGYFADDDASYRQLVPLIKNSGKPVLALGYAGARMLERLGLDIGSRNGWGTGDSGIHVMNPASALFKSPVAITIPPDSILSLYVSPTTTVAEYEQVMPAAVQLMGRSLDNPRYFSLVSQGRHFLWGFEGPPSAMTQAGRNLFWDVVSAMVQQVPDTLPGITGASQGLSPIQRPMTESSGSRDRSTLIEYEVLFPCYVSMTVFNGAGSVVATPVHAEQPAGRFQVTLDATNLPAGTYFYRLREGDTVLTKQLTLLR